LTPQGRKVAFEEQSGKADAPREPYRAPIALRAKHDALRHDELIAIPCYPLRLAPLSASIFQLNPS